MVARVFVCYKNERQKQKDSPNQGSNLGPYPGKRIHILLIKARCEGYVITATLSGLTNEMMIGIVYIYACQNGKETD